ncbi:Retrovirus Polyprotein [Phytophthora megakarya]|uniref:Retrovirus Polyprotein n=1 Tax=Phytophthora megakarya TaxID=4795 RepID=A0A225VDL5_9STRA|nr:Retrovirus Polyprotein [Phytophthora megakarya]
MQKRRRHAQAEDRVIEENVEKMLKAGVIEEGDGAWGFPVILVRKKNGEVRFSIDYRALNKVTKKDVYPLPRIDETLEALGGALLFSTLDRKAGYWQILVAAGDRDKTAFTTKKGLFRFIRMPFGLTNAPLTFQRMMNSVLRGLTWSTCLVYLDDIVVFTRGGIERHVLELATVLERLASAGLTLKLKKCRFATRSMEYLGHELSHEGVRPLQRLVTAVAEFPTPTDAVEVKRFVHLVGYYRRFVKGFGSMMAPLSKLLRKRCTGNGVTSNVHWEWGDEQRAAFERVKAVLTSKPLLVYQDFQLPFTLVTDASKVGLGAVLMQDQGNGLQPVSYASKVASETEANYGITELECLAVVWAIKLYRPYLYGQRFTIVTDHSALKWLMTSPNLAGKLHRWALTLQEFDFEVQYRPGSTNLVADALSRAPVVAAVRAAVGRRRRDDPTLASATGGRRSILVTPGAKRRSTKTVAWAAFSNSMRAMVTRARASTGSHRRRMTRSEALRSTPAETREVQVEYVKASTDDEEQDGDDDANVVKPTAKSRPMPQATATSHAAIPEAERLRAVVEARRTAQEPTLQLTDADIVTAQKKSRMVQRLVDAKEYRGKEVKLSFGLAVIETTAGSGVILPQSSGRQLSRRHTIRYGQGIFAHPTHTHECHKHIGGRTCNECGSRKARSREVFPPLRSLRGGSVCDRLALDVAGPLPTTDGGKRYVVAAVEYVTRYAVAATVKQHTADMVAEFLMRNVVLKFGPFRELLTDGAPELTGHVIEELVELLQAHQKNPVPYRPQMIGLVERFNRTWKDMVATFIQDGEQRDWDQWVDFAVYAYNLGRHSTVKLTPNELMMGGRLNNLNELLRATSRDEVADVSEYHKKLVATLEISHKEAERAREREQRRQAKYYGRRVRAKRTFNEGDRVWMFKPPRGPKASKFAHQWMGPLRIVEAAGFDNYLLEREDTEIPEKVIAHASFLVSYHHPTEFLREAAADIEAELEQENALGNVEPASATEAATGSATAAIRATATARGEKRGRSAVEDEGTDREPGERVVELRRRRRRNAAGQYVLEFEVRPVRDGVNGKDETDDRRRWLSMHEYERRHRLGGVVEDSKSGEVV